MCARPPCLVTCGRATLRVQDVSTLYGALQTLKQYGVVDVIYDGRGGRVLEKSYDKELRRLTPMTLLCPLLHFTSHMSQ